MGTKNNFKPLIFINEFKNGLFRTKLKEDENYLKEIGNVIANLLPADNEIYDVNKTENMFKYLNGFIRYNKNNYQIEGVCKSEGPIVGEEMLYSKYAVYNSLNLFGCVFYNLLEKVSFYNCYFHKIDKYFRFDNFDYFSFIDIIVKNLKNYLLKDNISYVCTYDITMMISALIEKTISLCFYSQFVNKIKKIDMETKKKFTKCELNIFTDFIENKFKCSIGEELILLKNIILKYDIIDKKSFLLIIEGSYLNKDQTKITKSLTALLESKLCKEIIPNNLRKFLIIIYKDYNLRNDILHLNTTNYNNFNIFITLVLYYILNLLIISLVKGQTR